MDPAAACTLLLMVVTTAFPTIRRTVSPMPIGLTPGNLSKATSRQATKEDKPRGSTKDVQIRLASKATVSQRSQEADLNEQQRRFHAAASSPDGPAAPSILSAVLQINSPLILLYSIG